MTDNQKEENVSSPQEINLNSQNETLKLIGNKREREKETIEDEKPSKKVCNSCNSSSPELLKFAEKMENSENIIELFTKEGEFIKLLKENLDKTISNNNSKLNYLCNKCLVNEFIKGGINRIFNQKKSEDNDKKEKIEQDTMPNIWNKKVKEIVGIYSLNLNIAIRNLRKLKDEYINITKNLKEIFSSSYVQILFSKNKDPSHELKKKIDNNDIVFKEIGNHFDDLINNLTQKEEMKTFILDCVLSNEPNQKYVILNKLKQLENEIENNTFEQGENNNTNKNIKDPKKEKDKKNIADMLSINNNDLLKNNILLSQNNLLNNGPNLFNSGLGILPLTIQANPSNNLLLNNLMLNSLLNPSILNQTNNTINLNSMLSNMNNNPNDANKNINNLNNLPFPGLNNLPLQNLNSNPLNNLDYILSLKNILNNNNSNIQPNNNMANNLYTNPLNPNIMPPLSLNNFFPPTSHLIHPNLSNTNSNSLNNNFTFDEKNIINRKNPLNIEKNTNINPNDNANIGNMSNIKDLNNIINNTNNLNEANKILQNNLNMQNPNNNGNIITQLFNTLAKEKKNITFNNNMTQK
jgi:hypothetical protein